jgi:amino acid transporter
LFPEDGGLYAWTLHAFGSRQAFLCSWFYFVSNLFYFPSLVLFALTTAAYMFGPSGASVAEKRMFAIPATLVLLWLLFVANFFGLKVARWVETLGAVAIMVVLVILVAFAWIARRGGVSATDFHLLPALDWQQLNLFSLIAFAFVGLELAPILSGAIRDPARNVPRAALLSGFPCLLFYICGTGAVLTLLKPDMVSPVTGLVQTGSAAQILLKSPGLAASLAGVITFGTAAQLATWITGNTRLPYVIGLAHYLPSAFARLHPRWRTPYVSLLFQAVVATAVLLMAQLGETVRATYQIMLDMLVLATFVPFLYVFASGWRFGTHVASLSGFAVTVLSIALSLAPPTEVSSVAIYELKVIGGFAVVALAGFGIHSRYEKRVR